MEITNLEQIAKAIPESSWKKLVDTACDTFAEIISPLTSITSGTGRLITAKFENWTETEKVLGADALKRAQQKSKGSKRTRAQPSLSSLIVLLDHSSKENNTTLRSLWINLLANELVDGSAHPEFIETLRRMSSTDAQRLAQIAESSILNKNAPRTISSYIKVIQTLLPIAIRGSVSLPSKRQTFTESHLQRLNLVKNVDGYFMLTVTGIAFIESVSDPSEIPES